jgi:crotonobetainyl-CoA:carnitine CoA-transferase CaiB-like acyl-CoA transferase
VPTGSRPLDGIVVLDLTIALAGPYATFLLAQLGARVIKVENPEGPDPCRSNPPYLGRSGVTLGRRHVDDVSVSALNRLRGKEAVTLNLKRQGSQEVFTDLVARADVLVENFSPGTLERLGVGYEQLRVVNPRLVYCSITGFGAAERGGKAMDTIVQALSGLMMTSGSSGEAPVRVGVPLGDMIAPLFGVIGTLAALQQRGRTGSGQHVDVSMLGALTSMIAAEPFDLLESCGIPTRTGATVPRLAPFGVYPTADGYVAICAPTEQFARGLFRAIDQPGLEEDPRFSTRDQRVANVELLNGYIQAFTRKTSTANLLERLERCGVPAAEVRSPAEAVRDPRVRARKETVLLARPDHEQPEVIGMGLPIRFSAASNELDLPAPAMGEHNHQIYGTWLGYSAERMAALKSAGVI